MRTLTAMRAARSGKSPLMWWALSTLAVLVLYVLSVPPAYSYAIRSGKFKSIVAGEPLWLSRYGYPYKWLHSNTPLRAPLVAYFAWWVPELELPQSA